MVQINPRLLEQPKTNGIKKQGTLQSFAQPQRNVFSSLFALARKQLEEALQGLIKSETVNVKVTNPQKSPDAAVNKILQKIDMLSARIAQIKITVPPTNVTLNIPDEKFSLIANKVSEGTGKEVVQMKQLQLGLTQIVHQLQELRGLTSGMKMEFPKVQQVSGQVKVTDMPAQKEWKQVIAGLDAIEKAVGNIQIDIPKPDKVEIPPFPKTISVTEGKAILTALKKVSEKLDELPKSFPEVEIPSVVTVGNFPPQKYPIPPTNININPLRGFAKSRNITVTSTPTPLPDEVLAYRRSLVVYNNSGVTIYVGGSDVTVTNGMPVPASSYSPAFDAGPKMIVYGIVASSNANVRTLELSNDNQGG